MAAEPLTPERRIEIQKSLLRALKGEVVAPQFIDPREDSKCGTCRDTGFVVEERFDGIRTSRRCRECKPRMDAEIRSQGGGAPAEDIPYDPAPVARDWKQLAGLDTEE